MNTYQCLLLLGLCVVIMLIQMNKLLHRNLKLEEQVNELKFMLEMHGYINKD